MRSLGFGDRTGGFVLVNEILEVVRVCEELFGVLLNILFHRLAFRAGQSLRRFLLVNKQPHLTKTVQPLPGVQLVNHFFLLLIEITKIEHLDFRKMP